MATLLVVDDEASIAFSIRECLSSDAVNVITAGTAREGLRLFATDRPDAVILDVRLPDMSGLDAYQQIAAIDPRIPVIIITAYASTETAIDAIRRGAFEYLVKPVDFDRLTSIVDKALEVSRLSRTPARVGMSTTGGDEPAEGPADLIVGQSPAMQEVYKAIGRVAKLDGTVLILGESGTGKELIARAIYHYSSRSHKPFLAINCAAIPETLLESELFGHEQGAFTGADRKRIGKFEQVDGGTIFLDEIGDMSLSTQAKALRLLQEQAFQRIGGSATVKTDVRVIAATNQNLRKHIDAGRFREDLFYRLNVFTISLPPLRERKEDLPLLIEHFIRRYNPRMNKTIHGISQPALDRCLAHDWPGNVRELESAIRQAMVYTVGDVILLDAFSLPDAGAPRRPAPSPPLNAEAFDLVTFVRALLRQKETEIYREITSTVDRIVMTEVMKAVDNNQVQACRRLGIARMTLRGKLQAMGWWADAEAARESATALAGAAPKAAD